MNGECCGSVKYLGFNPSILHWLFDIFSGVSCCSHHWTLASKEYINSSPRSFAPKTFEWSHIPLRIYLSRYVAFPSSFQHTTPNPASLIIVCSADPYFLARDCLSLVTKFARFPNSLNQVKLSSFFSIPDDMVDECCLFLAVRWGYGVN